MPDDYLQLIDEILKSAQRSQNEMDALIQDLKTKSEEINEYINRLKEIKEDYKYRQAEQQPEKEGEK